MKPALLLATLALASLLTAVSVYAQTNVTCATNPCPINVTWQTPVVVGATLTRTPTPTNTPVPPTPTPTSGVTAHPNHWHPPTDHEHGDQPPAWAEAFSLAQFSHGIVFGGNEASSPMENVLKHQAFKFAIIATTAGGEVLLRVHAGSNPLDRSAQYHSFEVYYLDSIGAAARAGNAQALAQCDAAWAGQGLLGCVSFFEGHYDTGNPNDPLHRCPRDSQVCGQPRILVPTGASCGGANVCGEQWYPGHGLIGLAWHINPSTTFYGGLGENATAGDQSTWIHTGHLGTTRNTTTEVFIYDWVTEWYDPGIFCTAPLGTDIVSDPTACHDGNHPMIWVVAPTMEADMRVVDGVRRISTFQYGRDIVCPDCRVPN